jgi:C-terminal processing protease CtpA/Prc
MPRARARSKSQARESTPAPGSGLLDSDRQRLIDTALNLIETLYVHLPLKRSMYAVNPLQRLKLLRRRLESAKPRMEDREFFNEMLSIFSGLRDLHTNFVLPEPFRSSTAFLPFQLEKCIDSGKEAYVVSHLMSGETLPVPTFQRGSVVTHWNGTPIRRAVAANAEREAGSNPAARLAQGLNALTIRWLGQSLLPDEEWVDITYLPKPGEEPTTARFAWKVFRRATGDGSTAIARANKKHLAFVGLDARGEAERQTRCHLFSAHQKQSPRVQPFGDDAETSVAEWARDVFPTCGNVTTASGKFAYVRIATFNVDQDEQYLQEFIRIISQLSQDGLILDVRTNGGGLISFGERMLQLLTPRTIDPSRFSFLNSVRTQDLTARIGDFGQWRDSIAQWVETGADYSQGFPLLSVEQYNDIGQKYQGPVVLITNALCYSTTDIFAAGFQDHNIGVILGVNENTGAGGANVWEYSDIAQFIANGEQFPLRLPQDASFRFAVRRVTRVGERAGVLLEDLGVKPTEVHQITRRDVLERNADLIEHAGKILSKGNVQSLTAQLSAAKEVEMSFQNLDRIDAYLGTRPWQSLDVTRSKKIVTQALPLPPAKARNPLPELRLQGFRINRQGQEELVAATRLAL